MNEIYIIIRIVSIVFDNSSSYREQIIFTHYDQKLSHEFFNFMKKTESNNTFEMQFHELDNGIFEFREIIK